MIRNCRWSRWFTHGSFNEHHSHKDDEADDGTKDDRHDAIWVANEFQYTPAMEPSTMDQMPAPAVAFFQVRPSRNAANGPADLIVKANTSIGMMALLTREITIAMMPRNSTHRRLYLVSCASVRLLPK